MARALHNGTSFRQDASAGPSVLVVGPLCSASTMNQPDDKYHTADCMCSRCMGPLPAIPSTRSAEPESRPPDTIPAPPQSQRPTIPVPPEHCEARAAEVYAHCAGLSFGASIAAALYEKGPL